MNRKTRPETRSAALVALSALVLPLAGCAVNPATGKRQLMLISESEEVEIGRENDKAIVDGFGLYDDEALGAYVARVGEELAAKSERPELHWTFRVLDDTLVNAFALPGGYIYVTRGILAYLESEAELASVLGHEIGHVTARHGASQMSKSQLAQLGLSIGAAATPERFQGLVGLAGTGLALLSLKYSRDDERQADDLGLRYIVRDGYDPRPMGDVFLTLKRVSEGRSSSGVPGWLSTHPDPENRQQRIADEISRMDRSFSSSRVGRDAFLERIDDMVYGDDPRQGYFIDQAYFHPGLRFTIVFPRQWKTANGKATVTGQSPEGDALIQVSLTEERTAGAALDSFTTRDAVAAGTRWDRSLHGLAAAGCPFSFASDEASLAGEVAFVEHEEKVFRLLALARSAAWAERRDPVRETLDSFAPLTERRFLDVEPRRIGIVTPDRSMDVAELASRYGAAVPADELAVLNGLGPGDRLRAGVEYKVVRPGRVPDRR